MFLVLPELLMGTASLWRRERSRVHTKERVSQLKGEKRIEEAKYLVKCAEESSVAVHLLICSTFP